MHPGMEGQSDGRHDFGIISLLADSLSHPVSLGLGENSGDTLQDSGKEGDKQTDEPQGDKHDGHACEGDAPPLSVENVLKADMQIFHNDVQEYKTTCLPASG